MQRYVADDHGGTCARIIDLSNGPDEHQPARRNRQYSTTVHDGPGVPARFWRLIRLTWPSGWVVTLVYVTEPADPSELPHLMWKLQVAAGRHGFEVEVMDAGGTTTNAPAIGQASSAHRSSTGHSYHRAGTW